MMPREWLTRAWLALTLALAAWGAVAAVLIFRVPGDVAAAQREALEWRASNEYWQRVAADERGVRVVVERQVVTNEIRVSQFTGALDALRSNYARAGGSRAAALGVYNSEHSN